MLYYITLRSLLYVPLIITIFKLINVNFNLSTLCFFILIFNIAVIKKIKNIYILFLILIIIIFNKILFFENTQNILLIYFINFILITYLTRYYGINKLKLFFAKNIKQVNIVIILISLINIFFFLNTKGWDFLWGNFQFKSIYSFPHDACYFFICMQGYCIIAYLLSKSNKIKILNKTLIILYTVFSALTNSRTPFLLSLFIFIYFLYKTTINKKGLIAISIFIITIVILINNYVNFIDYSKIPIINKFVRGIEIGNISSSRDLIWESIWNTYYYDYDLGGKLFGGGFGISRNITEVSIGSRLWSHNDLLEVLISNGLIGVSIYLYSFFKTFKMSKSWGFIAICFLLLFNNGLYGYYSITLCLPAVILAINLLTDIKSKEKNNEEKINVFNS